MKKNAFAEIIESSLHGFLAQSWQWNNAPEFGALVTVQEKTRTIIGIVHQVNTGSMDPVRYPFPYQKTQEELLKEQPQIFEFLKTTFSCLIIGYKQKEKINYTLAPKPCTIHSFVEHAPADLQTKFFAIHNYLHVLFSLSGSVFNIDELLLALLQHQANAHMLSETKLTKFMNTYSLLTGNDYRRMKLFLQRAQSMVQ